MVIGNVYIYRPDFISSKASPGYIHATSKDKILKGMHVRITHINNDWVKGILIKPKNYTGAFSNFITEWTFNIDQLTSIKRNRINTIAKHFINEPGSFVR